MNAFRELLEAGVTPEELAASSGIPVNRLAEYAQMNDQVEAAGRQAPQQQMPQPRYDIPELAPNTMRVESGPNAGKVIDMNFRGSAQPQPEQRLGEAVEVVGKGMGRYAPDRRSVVFEDGSRHDLFPRETAAREKAMLDRAKFMQGMRKGEADIAQAQEQVATSQGARAEKERERQFLSSGDMQPQAMLARKYGTPEKGMQWTQDGRAVPIPGGSVEQAAKDTLSTGTDAINQIDAMIGKRDANGALVTGEKAHPGFETAVGLSGFQGGFGLAGLIPGTDTSSFKARLDQLKGGAFLQAYNSLKGGGAITEVEGKKATDAITRMNTSQSEAEFVKAAQEYRDVISRGVERAKAMGGGGAQPGPQSTAPAASIPTGAIDKLRANPALSAAFDAKYGQGAAARAMGR